MKTGSACCPAVLHSLSSARPAVSSPPACFRCSSCHVPRPRLTACRLFDNRLGDEGAAAVARILKAHPGDSGNCPCLRVCLQSNAQLVEGYVHIWVIRQWGRVSGTYTHVPLMYHSCQKVLLLPTAGMLEVHLSHNMLTLRGATALLEALPVPGAPTAEPAGAGEGTAEAAVGEAAAGAAAAAGKQATASSEPEAEAAAAAVEAVPSKPMWLRLEWNRISLGGLMQVRLQSDGRVVCIAAWHSISSYSHCEQPLPFLDCTSLPPMLLHFSDHPQPQALEEQHGRRGLLVDLPTAVRPDAAPSLPDLPPYLAAAAARAPAAPTTAPASRGARSALQFVIDRCHARLPWIRCGAAGMGVGGWPSELQWEALH